MQVTHLRDAHAYMAPLHHDVLGLRLQGHDATHTKSFWVGLSYFLPGGCADRSVTPFEKVYVVVEGELTLTTDENEQVLCALDSCVIPAGEYRAIVNRTNRVASMLVIIPYASIPE